MAQATPIYGYTGSIDRYGIQQHHLNYTAADLTTVGSVAQGLTVNGIPELSREMAIDPSGTITVTITYEGVEDPSKFAPKYQYALKTSFKEEPLEAHPDILKIAAQYGGQLQGDGRYLFPLYLPASADKFASFGSRGNQATQTKNPFFGVEKFMVLMVNWQRMYAASNVQANILSNVGQIIGSPPGNPPSLPNRSQWLVMPPQGQQRGNIFIITEEYQLLEANSPPLLYSAGTGASGTSNSGSSMGALMTAGSLSAPAVPA